MDSLFATEIKAGLSANPKYLSSKYFYDDKGSQLFQAIMNLDEYYLTNLEHEIFEDSKSVLAGLLGSDGRAVKLIEFGAGDGTKTRILLEHFMKETLDFEYVPIDISIQAIEDLTVSLQKAIPELRMKPVHDDYFSALDHLDCCEADLKMVLFLGSNIGNFTNEQSVEFLTSISSRLNRGDYILVGFDLKKDPVVVLNAYNDKNGVTRDFNLNLLTRINRELGGDFVLDNFYHFPIYDPVTGAAKSYLISKVQQSVRLQKLDATFEFAPNEPIFMEVSQKYDMPIIHELGNRSGLRIVMDLTDGRNYFSDVVFQKL